VRTILSDAGFSAIEIKPYNLSLDIAVGRGLEGAVKGTLEIGPVSRTLEGQTPEVIAAVANAIRTVLAPLVKGDSVPLGASVSTVTAACL
jgi:hypothetical protein